MSYIYRRCDTDELVEVDFETMLTQTAGGFVTLPDGTVAKRCVHLEIAQEAAKTGQNRLPCQAKIISSAMGFIASQIGEFEADRIKHGFTDIEFVPAKDGYTYDVVCGSEDAKRRYATHRGYSDFGQSAKIAIDENDIKFARDKALEKYPLKHMSHGESK